MANIRQLKEDNNQVFYPQTHEKAVIDSNGVTINTKIASKQDTISDLSAIRSGASAGATAYQKPSGGVPKSDLASSVQTSLGKADTAIQPAEFNELEKEVGAIGNGAYEEAWDGSSAPVVADIPAGVSVTYNSTSYTGTLAASASTVDKIYLVSDGNGNYDRYTTVEANGAYSWKKVGSTAIPLSNYATKSEISQLRQEIDGAVVEHFTRGGSINSGGTVTANDTYCYSDWIPISPSTAYKIDYGYPADTQNAVEYNSGKSKTDYYPLYPGYAPVKEFTTRSNSAYLRFSFLPSYNAKVYQGDTLIWQAQDITPGLEDRVEALEREVPGINADVQTLSGKIDSVKDDVSKIAVDKNTIDYGIKAGYEFSRISGTPLEDITVSETETGINIAKTGGTNLSFKIRLPQISKAGTYHIVFSSNKEMTSVNIYKNDTFDSSVQATDNVCEFDYVYDGTYVLAIGTSMYYDKSSQDYSLIATVPNATGMNVVADNISERVQALEDSEQSPIPASVEGTNTFIGDGAGQNNTPIEGSDNGKYNTAVGKNAMLYNTLGDHCTALGFCAMNKNQDGRNNTALGEDALYENLHGGQNVAIGQHSGQDSQGGYNVFIGSNVARRMASGNLNVIIGAEAYNDYDQLGGNSMVLIGAYVRNTGNYDGVISIRGEEPTAAKEIRIGKADFSAFVIGNKRLNFNNDGTVTWTDVTPNE